MAPKCKSTPSWNPLCSGASTSSNPTPSHIRFRDKKTKLDFFENFSRRGVHSERQVILSDYSNTDLPTIIHNRGWESLCDVPITCPSVLIQEFYSNMHEFDYSVPLFVTRVQGMRIVVKPDIVSDVLRVSRVEHPDYPGCDVWGMCPKTSSYLLFVSVLLFGVIVSSPCVQPLLKALGFLTWSRLLFCILFLTITLLTSLVLDFCILH